MTAIKQTETVPLILCGCSIPMRRTLARNGNPFWAVLAPRANAERRFSVYGVPIPALDGQLPAAAVVGDGVVVDLTPVTEQTVNGLTRPVTRPKVRGSAPVTIDGQPLTATITVSERQSGDWNLKAAITRMGASGGGRRPVGVEEL